MFNAFDRDRLGRTRESLRAEQLQKLKFSEAFRDTLSMMALLIDMTAYFTTPSEFQRLPDHCGSLPPYCPLHEGKKKTNPRRRS